MSTGTIAASITPADQPIVRFVSEEETLWGKGHFTDFIDPTQFHSFPCALQAAEMIDAIVQGDLGLYKHLIDPNLFIDP